MATAPDQPVMRAYLRDIEASFELPRAIGPDATLALSDTAVPLAGHDASSVQTAVTHVLDIKGVEERNAIVYALNIVSTIRMASRCSVALISYAFPGGQSIDAFETNSPVWGHYDQTLTVDTVTWVESHLEDLKPYHIPESYSRIGNAIRLHGAALHTGNADLALLGFVGAIESLFSIAPQELSFRLSLLLAKFLGDGSAAQHDYFSRARELYTVRSKIAHGDRIHRNEEAAAIQIVETWTPEAEELARESLCRVFEKGLATVFDSKKRHEALLIDLLFESGLDDTITAMSVGASND